jgi:hypothetical protein
MTNVFSTTILEGFSPTIKSTSRLTTIVIKTDADRVSVLDTVSDVLTDSGIVHSREFVQNISSIGHIKVMVDA